MTMTVLVRRCKRCNKLHKPDPENLDDEDVFCDICTFIIDNDSSNDESESDEKPIDLSNLWKKKPFIDISESESSDEESTDEEEEKEDSSHEVDALWNFYECFYKEDGVTLILSSLNLPTKEENSTAKEPTIHIPKDEFNFRGKKYDRKGLLQALIDFQKLEKS